MVKDAQGRRSRFVRTPTNKQIVIGGRDCEILTLLYRYRYLRTAQLIAFLKPRSEKRFIERLGDLFHETGLIGRPTQQWQQGDRLTTPLIYEITARGIRYLEDKGILPHRATSLARRIRSGSGHQFPHAMMIMDALTEIELKTLMTDGERFVPVDEILARAPEATRRKTRPLELPVTLYPCKELPWITRPMQTHVVPDGLYGIEYIATGQPLYRFYALECERKTPQRRGRGEYSSVALKKAAYAEVIRSGVFREVWGVPNLSYHSNKIT